MLARRRQKSRGGTQRGSRASLVDGRAGRELDCRLSSVVVVVGEEEEQEVVRLLERGEVVVPALSSRSSTPLGTSSSRKSSHSSTVRDHWPLRAGQRLEQQGTTRRLSSEDITQVQVQVQVRVRVRGLGRAQGTWTLPRRALATMPRS